MAGLKIISTVLLVLAICVVTLAQKVQVRVNVLNVCTPNDADQKAIAAALESIPRRPVFAPEFEVARGRSVAADGTVSRWVRIRHEFGAQSPFANAQYLFSMDDKATSETTETLVLRLRDAKDLMQISIESHANALTPASMLSDSQQAQRIGLERFGKPSVALARCEGANQTAYEPLFRTGTEILRRYRTELNATRTVQGELSKLGASATAKKKSAVSR